jgi:hypothetical protein
LFFIFSSSSYAVQHQCAELFRIAPETQLPEFTQTLDALQTVLTDKNRIYSTPRNISAYTFISELIAKQKVQLEALRQVDFSQLSPQVVKYYLDRIEKAILDNEAEFIKYQTEENLDRISIKKIREANANSPLSVVRDHISSFAIATNTIIAELLTAIKYPEVINTEEDMPTLFGRYWYKARMALLQRMAPTMERYFESKRIDLKVRKNGVIYFLEVKYLGTNQYYNKASGDHVLQKLENVKFAAEQTPVPTKVALVLIGPGELSSAALNSYYELGIEVIHLTPEW